MTFVVTGDVHHYKNRNELKAYIESQGGKVTGSVSKSTHYLINNDAESQSSKNKKAHELNIPIITEEQFIAQFGEEQEKASRENGYSLIVIKTPCKDKSMKMKAFAFTGRIISSDSESYNFHSSPFSWYKHKCYFAFFFSIPTLES